MNFAKLDRNPYKKLPVKDLDRMHSNTEINNRKSSQNLRRNSNSRMDVSPLDTLPSSPQHSRQSLGEGRASLLGLLPSLPPDSPSLFLRTLRVAIKYMKFLGPGIMVSVSFIDPGNYSASVAGGSVLEYKLLFTILLSNFLAAFLQILCTKLGCVTGLNLAQNCRAHLPPRLNMATYILAELAIIATDLAEVVGTAIALNILFGLPLYAGVLVTILDVMIILFFYRPKGPLFVVRIFEGLVTILVAATVVCFAVELDKASDVIVFKDVMEGFLPHKKSFRDDGLYLSLAILGATVMPHSLYLGLGVVQPRLKDYDIKNGNYIDPSAAMDEESRQSFEDEDDDGYRPSLEAINETMSYSIIELLVSLFTVALFVNASILIIAGALLYDPKNAGKPPDADDSADLFSIYELLRDHLSPLAGKIFALALLFSGQSAGIVVTLSGQMISEGFLTWTMNPVIRRLLTRSIAVLPCLVLTMIAGRRGLANVLNVSQVVLSLLLPFVSAPLVYFTCSSDIMRVNVSGGCDQYRPSEREFEIELAAMDSPLSLASPLEFASPEQYVDMSNGKVTKCAAIITWVFITVLNLYLIGDMIW
ncbi:hypothetical protein BABINDRAFT_160692 [Babjeviella inositovora NRRL Y-12698]|uniref:Uncharacterized protein n=1 Tax=Babjeviella inositovora NRRL Y-12698 TaxID=984486 RepID=A0A1E3QUG9_9ASCO|nr:uncharacterized protein BABINDRAFT_160692 [Babjeviella inositovora NRRL Y-12698]ODQ81333.1 hypothetical protein BABINDRAFT_160692 [Babjeviella inositovora NRRL Y-12698]